MTLVEALDEVYPAWREHHRTPLEAAVEFGLFDEGVLDDVDYPELDFSENYHD